MRHFSYLLFILSVASLTAVPTSVARQNPLAHYRLDGDATDSSVNGLDGVLLGTTPAADRFGIAGAALSFNGSTDRVDLGNSIQIGGPGDELTLALWLSSTGTGTNMSIVTDYDGSFAGGDDPGYFAWFGTEPDGRPAFTTRPEFLILGNSVTDGSWHHLAVTLTAAGTMTLYIDGAVAGTRSFDTSIDRLQDPFWRLGAHRWGDATTYHYPFGGSLDDVRIYDVALSDAEIAALVADGDDNGLPDRKEAALARLVGVTCGSAPANKQMQLARGFLAASLAPALWADALHPDRLVGKAVFQNEQKAAYALERAMVLGTTCDAEAEASLDDLVAVDALLAQTAFDDATAFCAANPGNRQCGRKFLEAAPALAAGNALAAANDWDHAIGKYMVAWSASVLTGGGQVRVRAGERSGIDAATAGADEFTEQDTPTGFALVGNYPNPFNPTTTIGFRVPESAHVNLAIYDITGRRVAQLVDGIVAAGTHEVRFDAEELPSGVYLYRLETAVGRFTGRAVLVR